MNDRPRSIEEIRDLWLRSRGAGASDWEQALGAVYDLGRADAWAERAARIAQLEAELAARDAALAAAHEALREIHREAGTHTVMDRDDLPRRAGEGMSYVRQVAGDALALASLRAAEELRLLRELKAADAATDAAVAEHLAGRGTAEAMYSAANDRDAALAALRRFREEQG